MPRRRSYQTILAEIRRLQTQADRIRNRERAAAIRQAKAIIATHELTAQELGFKTNGAGRKPAPAKVKGKSAKIPPKYRGPGGITWTGRGKTPVWLREAMAKGRKKEDFLIRR